MNEIEFEVAGTQYRAVRLDAFKQLHVTRKLAPIVPKLIPAFIALQDGVSDVAALAAAAGPFADALASMAEDDVNYVVLTCLANVKRQQAGVWSPMAVNGTPMFADLSLDALLPIVVRVLRENLGNFIQGLLAKAPALPSGAPAAA